MKKLTLILAIALIGVNSPTFAKPHKYKANSGYHYKAKKAKKVKVRRSNNIGSKSCRTYRKGSLVGDTCGWSMPPF